MQQNPIVVINNNNTNINIHGSVFNQPFFKSEDEAKAINK